MKNRQTNTEKQQSGGLGSLVERPQRSTGSECLLDTVEQGVENTVHF